MSRTIHNPNLARLCRAHELRIADLNCALKCTQRAIYFYATGRKPMPLLERKLATVFNLTVPDFRKIIFNKRRNHDRDIAACQQKRIHHKEFWRYDPATQQEIYCNHGDQFSQSANFIALRTEGMRYPHGAVIKGHVVNQIAIIQLFAVNRPRMSAK